MTQSVPLEITLGRIASVRLGPNQDLLEGLAAAAAQLGFRRALVRSGLGSLTDAALQSATGAVLQVTGPAIELLSLSGEIALDGERSAGVGGLVGDMAGAVWAGRFLVGQNPVCVTVEAILEEIVTPY
jgi:predicted DNA-binding protein with PD1-like motif